MLSPNTTPSLVPEFDVGVHIVLDDFGKAGRLYREIDEAEGGLEAVINNLLTGQYNKPLRIVAFNTAEGWSRDISEDIAWELLSRSHKEGRLLGASTRQFVEFHVDEEECPHAQAGLA